MTHETVSKCGGCGALVSQWLCTSCVTELREGIARIALPGKYNRANLLDELDTVISRQARMSSKGRRGKGAEQPMIVDLRAAHEHEQLVHIVRRAFVLVGLVSYARTAHGTYRWPAGARAQALIAAQNVERIVMHPECVGLLTDMRTRIAEATRVIDRPPDQWYIGQCTAQLDNGVCTRDLYAREGASSVRCPGCRTEHDVSQRRAVLLEAVENVLATATEIARAVHLLPTPVTRATIYSYAHRGRLVQKGTSTRGEPLYRVGDVLDLVRQQAQRRATSKSD